MAFGQHKLRSWLSCMALTCLSACDWTTEENESCLDGGDGVTVMAVVTMVSVATVY